MWSTHSLLLLIILLYFLQELTLSHRIWWYIPYFLVKFKRFLLFLGFLYTSSWFLCVIGSKDLIHSCHIFVQLIQYHLWNDKIHHPYPLMFSYLFNYWKIRIYIKKSTQILKMYCILVYHKASVCPTPLSRNRPLLFARSPQPC